MDAEEEPVSLGPSVVTSKEHVHRKLLETIYEAPKHSRDGTEQFTSIRKYKRFIDFTEAPSAAKKWKRTQKALRLASTRRVAPDADPCEEHVNGDTSGFSRPMRHSTRHKQEVVHSVQNSLVVSSCRRRPSVPRRKASQQDEQVVHTNNLRSACQPELLGSSLASGFKRDTSVQVIILENGDMTVEEGATVELPYEIPACGEHVDCSVLSTGVVDNSMQVDIQSSAVQRLMTADTRVCEEQSTDENSGTFGEHERWSQLRDGAYGDCADDIARQAVSECDIVARSGIVGDTDHVDHITQLRPLTETVKRRKRKVEPAVEDDIVGVVGDLSTIVETACFLRDVSSSVADHCSAVDCDTVDAAEVVCRVIEKVSSELSEEK